jgi:hypothetical protein
MCWRDLDVCLLAGVDFSPAAVLELLKRVVELPGFVGFTYRDERGQRDPTGEAGDERYHLPFDLDTGQGRWRIDLSVFLRDLHVAAWHKLPVYPKQVSGWEIYTAVLRASGRASSATRSSTTSAISPSWRRQDPGPVSRPGTGRPGTWWSGSPPPAGRPAARPGRRPGRAPRWPLAGRWRPGGVAGLALAAGQGELAAMGATLGPSDQRHHQFAVRGPVHRDQHRRLAPHGPTLAQRQAASVGLRDPVVGRELEPVFVAGELVDAGVQSVQTGVP